MIMNNCRKSILHRQWCLKQNILNKNKCDRIILINKKNNFTPPILHVLVTGTKTNHHDQTNIL